MKAGQTVQPLLNVFPVQSNGCICVQWVDSFGVFLSDGSSNRGLNRWFACIELHTVELKTPRRVNE